MEDLAAVVTELVVAMAAMALVLNAEKARVQPLANLAIRLGNYMPVVVGAAMGGVLAVHITAVQVAVRKVLLRMINVQQTHPQILVVAVVVVQTRPITVLPAVPASSSSATHGRWRSNGKNHGCN